MEDTETRARGGADNGRLAKEERSRQREEEGGMKRRNEEEWRARQGGGVREPHIWQNKVADIGDVDPDAKKAVLERLDTEGIVKVPGRERVDGEDAARPETTAGQRGRGGGGDSRLLAITEPRWSRGGGGVDLKSLRFKISSGVTSHGVAGRQSRTSCYPKSCSSQVTRLRPFPLRKEMIPLGK